MELRLTDEEIAVLANVLERFIPNLRAEISNTENYDWRKSMQRDEELAKGILDRLKQAGATQRG